MPGALARLTAEVDLAAVAENVRQVQRIVGQATAVMAVVKADGYGHGARQVASAALAAGARWLGVATVDEGVQARGWFADVPICVFAPFPASDAEDVVRHRLVPFVGDVSSAQAVSQAARRTDVDASVHLELDTGMGRSGVLPEDVRRLFDEFSRLPRVRIAGLATHFPCAENDPAFTLGQVAEMQEVHHLLSAMRAPIGEVHCANSAALLAYPQARQSMVRPGLLIYGIVPAVPEGTAVPAFLPALALKSRVLQVRSLPKGHTLSYARTHQLSRPSRVAVLGVGYGDGYPRALSNRGSVLVGGRRAPIVGRVCMDVTLVDVTDIPDAAAGSEAVLVGLQGAECIRVEEIAAAIGTTEHDVTTRLTARVSRVFRGEPAHAASTSLVGDVPAVSK